MKLIPVPDNKYPDKFAKVDDEDFHYLMQFDWHLRFSRDRFYAFRVVSAEDGVWTTLFMHREILGLTDPNILSDHRDDDGLNNQRSNLRIATRSQNGANRKKKVKCTSKYLGVSRSNYKPRKSRRVRSWLVHCKKDGVIYSESHYSEREAARAYNRLAKKHHGRFAKLNKLR